MGYERYPRNSNPQDEYYGRRDTQDDSRDDGAGRDYGDSSSRGYGAAGGRGDGRQDQAGDRNGRQGYGQRDASRGYSYQDEGRADDGQRDDRGRYGQTTEYHGSYASDGRRFEDVGRYAHADDDDYARDSRRGQARRYGSQPQSYVHEDRGFFQRAGDEVRSWFGDEDAERRRDIDQRYDERNHDGSYGARAGQHRDSHYHSWRSNQIAALDRDYDEYRQENRSRFESEFSTWRTARQGQRDSLSKVAEHMDVVGSDGEHVGTVDKVRGDRILLTKNDADAGGRHHSIPSRWVQTVDGKVTLTKTAAEAKQQWQDEERDQAMFRDGGTGDAAAGSGAGNETQASSRSSSSAKTY